MSPAPVAELQATLSELDRLIQREHGELHARFRPGLSARELESLAASLQPYYLPAELIALYRWHDGWQDSVNDEYRFLLPDASFNSLAEAIKQYEIWWGALGSDGWHPLWFPAFGDQSGELVTLQFEPNEPAGPVFAFHSDLDLYTSYDSVTALFATTLECWRAGIVPHDPSYLPPEIREIALRHNPLSRTPDGGYRREISRSSTEGWPLRWKEVLGIAPTAPGADELVVTVAEFLADPRCGRPIHGVLHGRGGSFDSFVATASDGTGSMDVPLKRDETENFREFASARRYEMWLVPLVDRSPLDELAEQMRGIAEAPAASYLATRIVPL